VAGDGETAIGGVVERAGGDGIDVAGVAADADGVIAVTGGDVGRTGEGFDVDGVVAGAGVDVGDVGGAVGGSDGEGVVAGAEVQVEGFDAEVADRTTHAQAGDGRGSEDSGFVVGVAGVVKF